MFVTESVDRQLDDLLERVSAKLQLSDGKFAEAESRYAAIGKWLGADGSVIASFKPSIYPQGSVRIGTTVKPIGKNEHDIDLVCELQLDWTRVPRPVELLNLVESRLRDHGDYRKMVTRKNRCIRVEYANQFHLDILPACPNPSAGALSVVVPDRAAQTWKHSNPKGYANWFKLSAKQRQAEFRKGIEPLPERESVEDLAPLQQAVQLIKRNRDVVFQDKATLAPISIVLTTLAAQNYEGQQSVNAALMGILNGIVNSIPHNGRLYVLNPTNPLEDFSERWDAEPKAYESFIFAMKTFRDQWARVSSLSGIHNVKRAMEELFGETLTGEVFAEHLKALQGERESGRLAVKRGSGRIIASSVASSVPIRNNSFYGD